MTQLRYHSGFGNEFASEAVEGALPKGQNTPQRAPLGLYTELLSGAPFTAPRHENRRSYLYRIRPSALHGRFRRRDNGLLRSAPFAETEPSPDRLRWDPLPIPDRPADFVDGLATLAGNGDTAARLGIGIHVYLANRPMRDRVFADNDGELLLVPQQGALLVATEMGALEVAPGEIAVLPRGVKFRVELAADTARGFVCENYGPLLRLPELGPIGAQGLANARDFLTPAARFEEREGQCELIVKFEGNLWATGLGHSPLDVVAWHGNYAPYKYDLANFMAINSVSFDHVDPSIFTVLTSPSGLPGTANVDFVIFPPRWLVAEHTFRPPYFHRNVMSEFMALVRGVYESRSAGFAPGGASLHNCLAAHGPDLATFEAASHANLQPQYLADTLAIMFETRFVCRPTRFALETPALQRDYDSVCDGFDKKFRV